MKALTLILCLIASFAFAAETEVLPMKPYGPGVHTFAWVDKATLTKPTRAIVTVDRKTAADPGADFKLTVTQSDGVVERLCIATEGAQGPKQAKVTVLGCGLRPDSTKVGGSLTVHSGSVPVSVTVK